MNSINSGGRIKCENTGGKKYLKDLEQGGLEIPARLAISNTNKKMTDVMQEKLNPLLRSTEESTINQNNYRALIIWYITNFCAQFEYFSISKFPEK